MLELIQLENVRSEIEEYRKEVEDLILYTKSLEIKTVRDAKNAINSVAKSRTLVKQIDAKKKDLTREARDYSKKINNLAKEFLEPLILVEDMIVQKFDHWKQVEESFDCETEVDFELSIFEDKERIRAELASAYERISHVFELEDINAVPLEYLTVDEDKVALALKNGVRFIPGLNIVKQTKTEIRRL